MPNDDKDSKLGVAFNILTFVVAIVGVIVGYAVKDARVEANVSNNRDKLCDHTKKLAIYDVRLDSLEHREIRETICMQQISNKLDDVDTNIIATRRMLNILAKEMGYKIFEDH